MKCHPGKMTLPESSEISVQLDARMSHNKHSSKDEHGPVPAQPPQEEKASQVAVLGTVELLENIFVHLPACSLYKVLEVCREWHTLVATSPKILEKLFVRVKEPRRVWYRDWRSSTDEWSPAPPGSSISGMITDDVVYGSNSWPNSSTRLVPWYQSRQLDYYLFAQPVKLNPLLSLSPWLWPRPNFSERLRAGRGEQVILTGGKRDHQGLTLRLDGLALSSQLTDPPTTQVVVLHLYDVAYRPPEVGDMQAKHIIKSGSGVTLRDIIASIDKPGECAVSKGPYGNRTSRSGVTLADFISSASCRSYKYDSVRLKEIQILLCSSIIPREDEWESIAAGQKPASS